MKVITTTVQGASPTIGNRDLVKGNSNLLCANSEPSRYELTRGSVAIMESLLNGGGHDMFEAVSDDDFSLHLSADEDDMLEPPSSCGLNGSTVVRLSNGQTLGLTTGDGDAADTKPTLLEVENVLDGRCNIASDGGSKSLCHEESAISKNVLVESVSVFGALNSVFNEVSLSPKCSKPIENTVANAASPCENEVVVPNCETEEQLDINVNLVVKEVIIDDTVEELECDGETSSVGSGVISNQLQDQETMLNPKNSQVSKRKEAVEFIVECFSEVPQAAKSKYNVDHCHPGTPVVTDKLHNIIKEEQQKSEVVNFEIVESSDEAPSVLKPLLSKDNKNDGLAEEFQKEEVLKLEKDVCSKTVYDNLLCHKDSSCCEKTESSKDDIKHFDASKFGSISTPPTNKFLILEDDFISEEDSVGKEFFGARETIELAKKEALFLLDEDLKISDESKKLCNGLKNVESTVTIEENINQSVDDNEHLGFISVPKVQIRKMSSDNHLEEPKEFLVDMWDQYDAQYKAKNPETGLGNGVVIVQTENAENLNLTDGNLKCKNGSVQVVQEIEKVREASNDIVIKLLGTEDSVRINSSHTPEEVVNREVMEAEDKSGADQLENKLSMDVSERETGFKSSKNMTNDIVESQEKNISAEESNITGQNDITADQAKALSSTGNFDQGVATNSSNISKQNAIIAGNVKALPSSRNFEGGILTDTSSIANENVITAYKAEALPSTTGHLEGGIVRDTFSEEGPVWSSQKKRVSSLMLDMGVAKKTRLVFDPSERSDCGAEEVSNGKSMFEGENSLKNNTRSAKEDRSRQFTLENSPAIEDLVESSLGAKGTDKNIISNNINDKLNLNQIDGTLSLDKMLLYKSRERGGKVRIMENTIGGLRTSDLEANQLEKPRISNKVNDKQSPNQITTIDCIMSVEKIVIDVPRGVSPMFEQDSLSTVGDSITNNSGLSQTKAITYRANLEEIDIGKSRDISAVLGLDNSNAVDDSVSNALHNKHLENHRIIDEVDDKPSPSPRRTIDDAVNVEEMVVDEPIEDNVEFELKILNANDDMILSGSFSKQLINNEISENFGEKRRLDQNSAVDDAVIVEEMVIDESREDEGALISSQNSDTVTKNSCEFRTISSDISSTECDSELLVSSENAGDGSKEPSNPLESLVSKLYGLSDINSIIGSHPSVCIDVELEDTGTTVDPEKDAREETVVEDNKEKEGLKKYYEKYVNENMVGGDSNDEMASDIAKTDTEVGNDQSGKMNKNIYLENSVFDEKGEVRAVAEKRPSLKNNLECSIDAVARGSGRLPTKALPFISKFRKDQISQLTRIELEELTMQKFCEAIAYRSVVGEMRIAIQNLENLVESHGRKKMLLEKQNKELNNVMMRFLSDCQSAHRDQAVLPIKVTRSVGLQVTMNGLPGRSKRSGSSRRQAGMNLNLRQVQAMSSRGELRTEVTTRTTRSSTTESSLLPGFKEISSPAVTQKAVPPTIPLSSLQNALNTPIQYPPSSTKMLTQRLTSPITRPMLPSSRMVAKIAPLATPLAAEQQMPNMEVIDLTARDDESRVPNLQTTLPTVPNGIRFVQAVNILPNVQQQQQQQLQQQQQQQQQRTTYLVPTAVMQSGGTQQRQVLIAPQLQAGSPTRNNTSFLLNGQMMIPLQTTQQSNVQRQLSGGGLRPSTPQHSQVRMGAPSAVVPKMHPAPLPAPPNSQPCQVGWRFTPPLPKLKIAKTNNGKGIMLSWSMTLSKDFAEIASYQLYAYQETSAPPNTNQWKKVGDVKALPLPMACTLTQFVEGHKYHFTVRAVDIHSRVGPFSDPCSIMLNSTA